MGRQPSEDGEKAVVWKPRREPSGETKSTHTSIFGPGASRTMKKKKFYYLLKKKKKQKKTINV